MKFQTLERDGWVLLCPVCNQEIRYTLINNQQLPVPFFYAEDCNDVLLRKKDQKLVDQIFQVYTNEYPSVKNLLMIWKKILEGAPMTEGKGRYGLWSNVKCSQCFTEIPYNNGIKNVEQRIYEPKIVLIDGASLVGDTNDNSWSIKVKSEGSASIDN